MEIADCIWDADTTFLCCPGMIDDIMIYEKIFCTYGGPAYSQILSCFFEVKINLVYIVL